MNFFELRTEFRVSDSRESGQLPRCLTVLLDRGVYSIEQPGAPLTVVARFVPLWHF